MLLHLSSDDAWKASYTDDAGRVLYEFDSPTSLLKDDMTLYRVIPRGPGQSDKEVVGQILFDSASKDKSIIIMNDPGHHSNTDSGAEKNGNGRGVLVSDMLRRSGPAGFTYGSHASQAFIASDGNEYEWVFGYEACSLHPVPIQGSVRENESNLPPPVMTFKHGETHVLSKSRKPTLEVSDGYENILEISLIILGYLEKARKKGGKSMTPAFFGGGSWAGMSLS